MNKLYSALAMFGMVLFANTTASAATATPKVVFIGDYITANWTSGFAANPNWINQGVNGAAYGGPETLPDIDAAIALHPAIIHILMGANVSVDASPNSVANSVIAFATSLDQMVKKAQAANIKVIIGLTPSAGDIGFGDYDSGFFNDIVAAYGTAHNIEVVNYADALCECISSVSPKTPPLSLEQMTPIPNQSGNNPPVAGLLPSAAGYALMTTLAQTAIADQYLTLKSGWLSNVVAPAFDVLPAGGTNLSTCAQTCVIQFTPVGVYSDGSTHPLLNTTWNGNNGTWTSSNPLVVAVNQQGLAYALTVGTATIKYTPANGVKINSWVMKIQDGSF
jgi:hypothetical protein